MKTILTRNQGRIGSKHVLTTPGYKTKPQAAADARAQTLMSKGSFKTPSCEPKTGKSNFASQGRADSIPMASDLKRGHTNFPKG